MSFLRWFAREGFRTLKYVFRGIFRSLLRYVPCTMHPPLFSHPLRVNGMAGVSLAPMPPGIALKTAAARYAPLRLHLADRAGLNLPVSTCPLAALFVPAMGLTRRGQTLTSFKNAPGVFVHAGGPGQPPAPQRFLAGPTPCCMSRCLMPA